MMQASTTCFSAHGSSSWPFMYFAMARIQTDPLPRNERASYNGSIEASQASDVGSIPIARSINPVDAVGFTGFHTSKWFIKLRFLDAVGRGFRRCESSWTRLLAGARGGKWTERLPVRFEWWQLRDSSGKNS